MRKINFKRITFIIIISLLLTLQVTAPTHIELPVLSSQPIEPYKQLIYAIGMVETKCDTLAYNPVEKAVGYFQIRPIRLKDYNRRTGNNYNMNDLYDYKISERIFLYYAIQIGPSDPEKIARRWNGSGVRTVYYWNKIKKYL